jgi:phosphopantothenoylcysteine decarboxylase/phosphopantothenate--cysteine ligase
VTAVARGARVTLVAANVALPDPAGVHLVRVESAEDLAAAVSDAAPAADAVVMAAAVADFRPVVTSSSKVKKGPGAPASIELTTTPDVLADLVAARAAGGAVAGQVLVGFAAETGDADGDVLEHGRRKLARKGCDLLVVNRVGDDAGFERPDNAAVALGADGSVTEVPLGPKEHLADIVWDLVAQRWPPLASR